MVVHKNIISILSLITAAVWLAVIATPGSNLQIIACDVGQGDAILVQYKNDQILIDGGPDASVLDCLGKFMPFWDRKIELVINTHPEKDHAGGLINVFDNYQVETVLINDLSEPTFSSDIVEVLQNKVGGSGAKVVYAHKGMKMRLGLIYLDVLHPYDGFQNSNANNYSVVTLLTYADFEAIFTGDIEDKVSDDIAKSWNMGHVDYIKIPHHGSKNGISESLLQVTEPKLGIISVAAKNSYGHPHKEVLDLLEKYKLKILRTDMLGNIVVESDGRSFWINNLSNIQ